MFPALLAPVFMPSQLISILCPPAHAAGIRAEPSAFAIHLYRLPALLTSGCWVFTPVKIHFDGIGAQPRLFSDRLVRQPSRFQNDHQVHLALIHHAHLLFSILLFLSINWR